MQQRRSGWSRRNTDYVVNFLILFELLKNELNIKGT